MRAHEFADQGAAGIILYAEDTGRYGLQQRSDSINDGGLWAAWGGGREPGESLEQCARRELGEESGYTGPIKLKRLAENARYVTFIGVVPHEFEPRPDPEWKDYCWVEAGDWPGPMHPGVAAALKNIPVNKALAEGLDTFKSVLMALRRDAEHYIDTKGLAGGRNFLLDINQRLAQLQRTENPRAKIIIGTVRDMINDAQRTAAGTKGVSFSTLANTVVQLTQQELQKASQESVAENFADGKVRGKSRPGRVKRAGASCAGSVTDLRAKAKKYGGERGKMYHWCANMKGGKQKANESVEIEIHNRPKLDKILARCIKMVREKGMQRSDKFGRVAACIIDSRNRKIFGVSTQGSDGWIHAEHMAIKKYHKEFGKIEPGAIIVTTLSPCNREMHDRQGPSCQDLLQQVGIEKVYTGYMDPTQHSDHPFVEEVTKNDDLWEACKALSDSFVHQH